MHINYIAFRDRLTKINEEEKSRRYETKKENADDMKYRGRTIIDNYVCMYVHTFFSFTDRLTKINEEEKSGRYETWKENADATKYRGKTRTPSYTLIWVY